MDLFAFGIFILYLAFIHRRLLKPRYLFFVDDAGGAWEFDMQKNCKRLLFTHEYGIKNIVSRSSEIDSK